MKHTRPMRHGAMARSVAASVDAPLAALPILSDLFADMPTLGPPARRPVLWLERAGVGPRSRFLDLGCGKGALAAALARATGCRVTGVDAFAPFLDSARALAHSTGVTDRCTFIEADYRAFARDAKRTGARFDAGAMIGVAPLDVAAPLLRSLVRPGGVYLIDDAVSLLRPARPKRAARPRPPTRTEARALIETTGDRVLREHVFGRTEIARLEGVLQHRLRTRARTVARARPALAPVIAEFLRRQRAAAAMLISGPIRPAMWLIRRAP